MQISNKTLSPNFCFIFLNFLLKQLKITINHNWKKNYMSRAKSLLWSPGLCIEFYLPCPMRKSTLAIRTRDAWTHVGTPHPSHAMTACWPMGLSIASTLRHLICINVVCRVSPMAYVQVQTLMLSAVTLSQGCWSIRFAIGTRCNAEMK